MKKNYLELCGNDTRIARNRLMLDLNDEIAGKVVESTNRGTGTIIKVESETTAPTGENDYKVEINFGAETACYLIGMATKRGSIVNEEVKKSVSEAIEELNAIYVKIEEELEKEEELKAEQRRIAEEEKARLEAERKQKEKVEKQIKRLETNKVNQIKNANNLEKSKISNITNEFYYSLGWLAKHAKKVSAAMPDYLDKWFVKIFGNVEHRSVDQSTLSPSGLPSQFALYMKIDLDTNTDIPDYLVSHLGDVSKDIKPISDTPFVFDLVRDYGFKFGKSQDVNEIEDCIPNDYLDDFRLGLSA